MADPVKPANDGERTLVADITPMLYKQPRPLDLENFGKHGLKRTTSFKFAAGCNTVPISIAEFQHAQKCYPIIFVGEPLQPAVVMGFAPDENLYVMPDGSWYEDYYIPAYMRRYPFVLAEVPGDERLYLCADSAAEVITDRNPDLPFFADGKATEVVSQALEYCRRFQEEIVVTKLFSEELKQRDLLKETELLLTLPDGTQRSAGKVVSIDAGGFLEKIPDDLVLKLRKQGTLPCIYFQQVSQANWSRLGYRKEKVEREKATKK